MYKGKWLRTELSEENGMSLSRPIFLTFSYLLTLFLLQAVCSGHPHDYSTWKTWTKHAESQLSSGKEAPSRGNPSRKVTSGQLEFRSMDVEGWSANAISTTSDLLPADSCVIGKRVKPIVRL